MGKTILSFILAAGFLAQVPVAAAADDIAQFKRVAGTVFVERDGKRATAQAGERVQQSDVIVTGSDGAAGLTFADNSLLSVGPNSTLSLDRFEFNSTTHEGRFDSSLKKGTLAVVSGKIVKQTPGAMIVRTPSAILGARGTEFVVRAD
ncbi:MAG: hypothetical protein FD134_1093 [Gallionellaceae bacterium]|nr:MAG: hypothetical protein FD134_1093 [Gallionellaceae bacterium]